MDSTGLQGMGDMAMMQMDQSRVTSGQLGAGVNADKAAQDFEGMFVSQMLQPMFDSVSVDPEFGGGHGEEVMRSFLVQEYGKIIAKTGGLGIGSMVKGEMIKAQQMAEKQGGQNVAAQ